MITGISKLDRLENRLEGFVVFDVIECSDCLTLL